MCEYLDKEIAHYTMTLFTNYKCNDIKETNKRYLLQ